MSVKLEQLMTNFAVEAFQIDLLAWFRRERRALPWRENKTAYRVWVSEVMLQQTRVDTVIPYFLNFVEQFPTIEALATADEEKVMKAWEGLGYYSRVRNLQAAVREVHEKYGGEVPRDPDTFASLKGVGPYTRGSVMSIAYGLPEPAVDGNVMRVFSRIMSIWDDISKPKTRTIFEDVVRATIDAESASDFNEALMELGAIVCTPKSPSCLLCPVREHCRAFADGTQSELPVKTKKATMKHIPMAVVVLTDKEGKFYIHKRPSEGLLANLWEFPNCSYDDNEGAAAALERYCAEQLSLNITLGHSFTTLTHVFSHLTWNIVAFRGTVDFIGDVRDDLAIVTAEQMAQFAFPVSHQNIYRDYLV